MNDETTATGIAPEMTIPDAVKIARQEAAKNTGEVRSALTMLADYAMPLIPHDEPEREEEQSEERKENSNAEKILKETAKRVFAAFKELADCSEILDEITPPVKLSTDDPYTDTTSDLAEFLNDSLRELDFATDVLRPWVQEVRA